MSENLTARAVTSIHSPKSNVWDALIEPAAIKQYMFGADVESQWRPGCDITWKGEMKGRKYEDKGVILKLEPGKLLSYSHFSPLSGKPDEPDNYHIVTIRLAGSGDRTEVSLTQDNNENEKARAESEKNWRAMLDGLKKFVETKN